MQQIQILTLILLCFVHQYFSKVQRCGHKSMLGIQTRFIVLQYE